MRISLDKDRFIETMQTQALIGATDGGGLHREALSDADKEVRDWFVDQLEQLDLEVRIDAFGNIFGRRDGAGSKKNNTPTETPILLGSHLDSQPYGGIYDGALGVIAALETLRTLENQNITTTHPIEIVNWTNEEGSRFQPSMQGSGIWTGHLDLEEEYTRTDRNDKTVKNELERIGYLGGEPVKPKHDYQAYLELHIEQGPYLKENDMDVGAVVGGVGISWGEITVTGEANHTGPTPMHHRKDALVAAADVITAIRRLPTRLGPRTVASTGAIDVEPNSINVIPETATFTWDIRDPDDEIRNKAAARVREEARVAAEREGVDVSIESKMDFDSVDFADHLVDTIEAAADALDYDCMRLYSGAGHDATHIARICDTAMVFAVSEGGKSHTEDEYTSWSDCYTAANTFANAALELAEPVE